MPTRVRPHELEDESIRRFEDALPPRWVYRRKSPDYGIDGEVEIFEADGRATGLSFLVQLRATDDAERIDVVPLKVSELNYYGQFDLPVAVVRYGSPKSSFFWQWASNIRSRVEIAEDQESFGYRYANDERWTDASGATIRRTLEVRRGLTAIAPSAALPLRIDLSAILPAKRYPVDRALGRMIATSRGALVRAAADQHAVEVSLCLEPTFLSVGIDTLASVTFDLVDPTPDDYVNYILYALARLFRRQRFIRQAEALAQLLVERGVPHHNQELAFDACLALARDLPALVELAIINGFHEQHLYHPISALPVAKAPQDAAMRTAANDRFFEAAVSAGRASSPATEAAAHYSIGNFYRTQRGLTRAISHYNRARRLRPAYLETGYFLSDLGSILYLAGHHHGAVRAYRAAVVSDDDPSLAFRFGDALLLAGDLAEARIQFVDVAARGEDPSMVYEAELKAALCGGLIGAIGANQVPRRRSEANQLIPECEEGAAPQLEHILRYVDALHPLAHFNLGILRSREGDGASALQHFLHCAFLQPHDLSAWSNAAISALGIDEDGQALVRILAVAIRYMGAEAYDHFRNDLVEQGAPDAALAVIDGIALPLIEEAERETDEGFTLRMLDGDSYQSMTIHGLGGA